MLKYNRSFYVGQQPPFDLLYCEFGYKAGAEYAQRCATCRELLWQGIDFVTPFQMSLLDNAIANNGDLMRPWLVTKIVDPTNSALCSHLARRTLGSKMKAVRPRRCARHVWRHRVRIRFPGTKVDQLSLGHSRQDGYR